MESKPDGAGACTSDRSAQEVEASAIDPAGNGADCSTSSAADATASAPPAGVSVATESSATSPDPSEGMQQRTVKCEKQS